MKTIIMIVYHYIAIIDLYELQNIISNLKQKEAQNINSLSNPFASDDDLKFDFVDGLLKYNVTL